MTDCSDRPDLHDEDPSNDERDDDEAILAALKEQLDANRIPDDVLAAAHAAFGRGELNTEAT